MYNGSLQMLPEQKEVFMIHYKKLRGNSPVIGYEIEPTRINVMFKSGRIYSYSYESAGSYNVEQMKVLAREGAGLSAYITRNARFNYEK